MKFKTKSLILIVLFICSIMILSVTAVSAADLSKDVKASSNVSVDNKINPTKTVINSAITKNKSKTLTKSGAKSYIKNQKSSSTTTNSSHLQAYDYKDKKMVWFNVASDSTIDQYPAGLRTVTKYSNSKVTYAIVTNTKTKHSYNSKTKTNTTTSYTVLYNIKNSKSKLVKVTKTSVKTISADLPNEYLEATTNAEVNNPRIVALAKEITKGCKSDDYYNKAKLIYKWVQVNIDYTLDANISAVEILSQKGSNGNYKAYCVGFSNVMAALCRAVDVPVRYHAIFFFEEEYYPFQGHEGHVYTQVYVDGKWLFADAATVGFIAPLNYHGYLEEMPTQPGGSYYTYTNDWNYWYFNCNYNLHSHSDPYIVRESQGIGVLEYFYITSATITSATTAYNLLYSYASSNGYYIYSSNYFYGTMTYINPSPVNFWAFNYYDGSGNFLGSMYLDENGILYPVNDDYGELSGFVGFLDFY